MSKIWLTSDWHFNHDKNFIWEARGFNDVQEMNEAIIQRHNEVIKPEDTLYILGDVMLGGRDLSGLKLIQAVNGRKVIIAGNHDTKFRKQEYFNIGIPVYDGYKLEHNKYNCFLSHWPTLVQNGNEENFPLHKLTLNFYGHTHQKNNFYNDNFYCYHVGVDSHNCYPVEFEQAIEEIRAKRNQKMN